MVKEHRSLQCEFCLHISVSQKIHYAHLKICLSSTKEKRQAAGLYCSECDISFFARNNFLQHRNNVHGKFECNECLATFYKKLSFDLLRRQHKKVNLGPKIYRCLVCPQKRLFCKNQFQQHFRIQHSMGHRTIKEKGSYLDAIGARKGVLPR
jgi:hypothetical protein